MSSNTVPAVLHSEWIKARSTVGSLVTLPLALVISLGLALAGGLSTRNAIDSGSNMLASDFNPINSGFNALFTAIWPSSCSRCSCSVPSTRAG